MVSCCLIRGVRKCENLIRSPKKKQSKIFKVIKKVLGNVRVLKSNTVTCPASLYACQENNPHASYSACLTIMPCAYELFHVAKIYAVHHKPCLQKGFVLFTKCHTTYKFTNCMSLILNHFFKTLFTIPTCFDSIQARHLTPCT